MQGKRARIRSGCPPTGNPPCCRPRPPVHVEPGEYQNGACWATASGWFMDAVREVSAPAARRILEDAYRYFERQGIYECVNGEYRKLPNYVVSAANLYGAAKSING